MFEAKFKNPIAFKKAMEVIETVVEFSSLEVTSEGISMQCSDTSRISFIKLTMMKEAFKSFTFTKNLSLSVKMSGLCKILKTCTDASVLTIWSGENDSHDYLNFKIKTGKSLKSYEYKLYHFDSQDYGMSNDLQVTGRAMMHSVELKRLCRHLDLLGNLNVGIKIDLDKIIFNSKGDEINVNYVVKEGESEENCAIDSATEPTDMIEINVKYFYNYTKNPINSFVEISIIEKHLLKLKYFLDNENRDDGYMELYIASYVPNEDI
ncbi:PCNA [Chrysodeixis chalcites nucleopolyhedrovirus]|uniref:PCNA n=1 Tax=Chrysodeixis chalcites nucleopolyhedrovirus TaxID=320432 RepID=Q4KT14_9ABAC|nr:PCNA [Chrysodeixis chalcites nucleopolyhedrovirus]AGC36280.1 PCNA [Chrysodeixis chalcites SNPV TF1-A]AAY83997.1 PCNA [Chrysodeixis chalcites nucleopolyhedrovirus]AGE61327.1 PCNA [Chrysodeixis chalcites nucleopolyhedrovirus]AGE61476.1 PCNA [Chrysodeixis chalcites nucleopolyhedrovirus]AGE61626.1 PCNA [Chrysodeixis chalcites nucleopolyhedrovirus]